MTSDQGFSLKIDPKYGKLLQDMARSQRRTIKAVAELAIEQLAGKEKVGAKK